MTVSWVVIVVLATISARLAVARTPLELCDNICSDPHPNEVCGTSVDHFNDKKVVLFENYCELRKHNCRNQHNRYRAEIDLVACRELITDPKKVLTAPTSDCEHVCIDGNKNPVCGQLVDKCQKGAKGYKEFNNYCALRKHNCRNQKKRYQADIDLTNCRSAPIRHPPIVTV